jgi:hypothetical protein
MIWVLLVILTVLGSAAAVGYAVQSKRRSLPGGGTKALPAGSGDRLIERGLGDLRVNDVVTIDAKDFLCEGRVDYDEDGHRWIGARIVDGSDARWLVIGIERAGTAQTRLLTVDSTIDMNGYPPEAIVAGEIRYTLDKRGTATCKLTGDLGGLGAVKGTTEGVSRVERCRWWLYSAAGDDTLIVEQWGSDYRVLRGTKVNEGTIDLIPGS